MAVPFYDYIVDYPGLAVAAAVNAHASRMAIGPDAPRGWIRVAEERKRQGVGRCNISIQMDRLF